MCSPILQSKLSSSSRLLAAPAMRLPTWVIQRRLTSTFLDFPQHALAQRNTRKHKQRGKAVHMKRFFCSRLHCYLGAENRSKKENSEPDKNCHDFHRDLR